MMKATARTRQEEGEKLQGARAHRAALEAGSTLSTIAPLLPGTGQLEFGGIWEERAKTMGTAEKRPPSHS